MYLHPTNRKRYDPFRLVWLSDCLSAFVFLVSVNLSARTFMLSDEYHISLKMTSHIGLEMAWCCQAASYYPNQCWSRVSLKYRDISSDHNSVRNSTQNAAVSLLCSVQIFKMIWQLKWMFCTDKISWDMTSICLDRYLTLLLPSLTQYINRCIRFLPGIYFSIHYFVAHHKTTCFKGWYTCIKIFWKKNGMVRAID